MRGLPGQEHALGAWGCFAPLPLNPASSSLLFASSGVSAASLMDLQAQLYQTQESVRMRQDGSAPGEKAASRRKVGVDVVALMDRKNAGVESRDQQDRLHVKVCVSWVLHDE